MPNFAIGIITNNNYNKQKKGRLEGGDVKESFNDEEKLYNGS